MILGFALLALFGPRILGAFWWLFSPVYFTGGFGSIIWPILGLVFVPWTTIAYVLVYTGGVSFWEWLLIALGLAIDIAAYGSSGYSYTKRAA